MDLLKSVIVQAREVAFEWEVASHQAWIDRNGHNASLDEIADKLEDAKAEVSDYTFDGLEMADCSGINLSEFLCRVLKGPYLSLQKSFS